MGCCPSRSSGGNRLDFPMSKRWLAVSSGRAVTGCTGTDQPGRITDFRLRASRCPKLRGRAKKW